MKTATIRDNKGDKLKLRMLQIKPRFPKYYMPVYEAFYPDADMDRAKRVWNGTLQDEKIVKQFETIAETLKHT